MKQATTIPDVDLPCRDVANAQCLATAFTDPCGIALDPNLNLNEKRAILAAWASDACAVDSAPAFRRFPDIGAVVNIDEILNALRTLDGPSSEVTRAQLRNKTRGNLRSSANPRRCIRPTPVRTGANRGII
jgi:hypothetical protein